MNPIVYWLARGILQPFFHLYFRMSRIGREHIPASGPVIIAANHRSFVDPFVIGTCLRRPVYYVAKSEIFRIHPIVGWFLSALGAFPVERGAGDRDTIDTAKRILERGDPVLMFPEGTRIRPGTLGRPKRGVGRLALETGAPVVPVAVIGTETIRWKLWLRPHKVRIRIGRPLTFPRVEQSSPQLAAAVTDRIWPNVMLQWEWLGGLAPLRRAAVIGSGREADALAAMLSRAGLEVDAGGAPELSRHDLVCFATAPDELPAALAAHGGAISPRAGVLVRASGLVPPLGTLPSAYVAERVTARAIGVLAGPGDGGAHVVAAVDGGFRRQVADALGAGGFDVAPTGDVVGVELAACAKDAAAFAAAAAASAGPAAAGTAAGKVFAEVDAYARQVGSRPETFAGLAGAGALVADVLADRRPGAAAASVPLLAARVRGAGLDAPVLGGLAGVIEGRVEQARWTAALTAPRKRGKTDKAHAA